MSRGHGGEKERDVCLPLPAIVILLLDNDDNDSGSGIYALQNIHWAPLSFAQIPGILV
jgi:hypothetical protein